MRFNRSTFENDFVILKLGSPLQFNVYVQPACLPTSQNFLSVDSTEDMCFTSGWGRLQYGNGKFKNLCFSSLNLCKNELSLNFSVDVVSLKIDGGHWYIGCICVIPNLKVGGENTSGSIS